MFSIFLKPEKICYAADGQTVFGLPIAVCGGIISFIAAADTLLLCGRTFLHGGVK